MARHEIKVAPQHYQLVANGSKTFECVRDERGYKEGDMLILTEWNGTVYTGRVAECVITNVYRGELVKEGYCLLSIQLVFPEVEPRLPLSVYMELYRLYISVRIERDSLKELL